MSDSDSTIAACLTPPGSAAIATVAIRGPRAADLVRGLFMHAAKDITLEPGALLVGRFGDDTMFDEVVVAVKATSPVPWLEIHCHGGTQVVAWMLELLVARGAVAVPWTAFLPQVETPARARALDLLARTTTARTAAIVLDQYHGAWEQALHELESSVRSGDLAAALRDVDSLLQRAPLGRHLIEPWRLVISGAPNVGKSSLANCLVGYTRSVVTPQAGTTRDVVTTTIALDGWPVELADTAGLRDASAELERAGMQLARAALAHADLCLWVVDGTAVPVWPDAETRAAITSIIPVVNKIDQPLLWDRTQAAGAVFISAQTGAGIPELCSEISRRLVPYPPPPGSAVPCAPSQVALLTAVYQRLSVNDAAEALKLLEPLPGGPA